MSTAPQQTTVSRGSTGPRTILITGAGVGLGRAIALHLAAPETRLLLHYRSSGAAVTSLAQSVRDMGAEAVTLQADLSRLPERERLMAQVHAQTRALHLLVNNVGVYLDKGLLETSPEDWQYVMEASCNAAHHLIHSALEPLRRGAPSQVINIGDSGSDRITARTTATPYHIAKMGLHVITRSYARLLGDQDIRVNQVSPGFMENSVGEPGTPLPMGRPGAYADILGAIDYLLSPAAAYVTGANLVISGGWNL